MKKIFVEREDEAPAVLQKVMHEPDPLITLVVPRGAALKDSLANFKLLKREAEAVQKGLTIESVDEDILTVAKAVGLEAVHPLFHGGRQGISDIVSVQRDAPSRHEEPEREKARVRKVSEPEPVALKKPEVAYEEPDEPLLEERLSFRERFVRPRVLVPVGIFAIAAAGFIVTTQFLSTAEISLNFKKAEWSKTVPMVADRALTKASGANMPAELFETKRNIVQFFPASGAQVLSDKAKGVITIYNTYSSQPQLLVATTRFTTNDGKVFRLVSKAQVPGAKVINGKITPASVEAAVEADAPGADYNRTSEERLSIPGFKDSPKYTGFYGVLKSASGGFVGKRPVPTDADIASAKAKTETLLRQSLSSGFLSGRPSGFIVPDGATDVQIIKFAVNKVADEQGNFSVLGEGRLRAIGFREADMRKELEIIARNETDLGVPVAERGVNDLIVRYKDIKPNFEAGSMTFSVEAHATLTADFSADDFRSKIMGQDVQAVRSQVASLSGLVDGNISVWPFWVHSISKTPSRITIVVQ